MAADPKPIEACKGWENSCAFCDKRFGEWKEAEDESFFQEVPEKAIMFMFALESKQKNQVVSIGVIQKNSQTELSRKFQLLRETISQRKSKNNKSIIRVRWLPIGKLDSKDTCVVLAHWYNYGILPRMTQDWPEIETLPSYHHLEFSESNNKWCYPSKNANWRKPKKASTVPKAVKKCNWCDPCPFCDARFTQWMSVEESLDRKLPPEKPGFYMVSHKKNDKYQVVFIEAIASLLGGIRQSLWLVHRYSRSTSKDKTEGIFVRWLAHNIEDEDSCFVHAHWLNCGDQPIFNTNSKIESCFGEKVLMKSKNFVFRNNDLQWCFVSEEKPKVIKISKIKEKRLVERSIMEELLHA